MPNSSPATSTSAAVMPCSQRSANVQRAASALSVRPISTYLASLLIRACARPASVEAACASVTTSATDAIPAACRRSSTAATSSAILALGGSAHCRQRNDVHLAAVQPLGHDLRPQAALAQPLHCQGGGTIQLRRSPRRWPGAGCTRVGPSWPQSNTSDPRLTQRSSRPGPGDGHRAAGRRFRRGCR